MPWWVLAIVVPMGMFLTQRWISQRPQGGPNDPLPMRAGHPTGPFREPRVRKYTPAELYDALRRYWRPDLTPAQAAPLIGQALLASQGEATNNNLINISADASWPGAWTMIPKAGAEKGSPVYRWRAIRAYPNLHLAIMDWVQNLPPGALAAVEHGNVTSFARALVEMPGAITAIHPSVYAVYLAEAASRWLDGATGKNTAHQRGV